MGGGGGGGVGHIVRIVSQEQTYCHRRTVKVISLSIPWHGLSGFIFRAMDYNQPILCNAYAYGTG